MLRSDRLLALGLTSVGALGFLGGGPWLGAWIWLALWAPGAGWMAVWRGSSAWVLAPPAVWGVALALLARGLPAPLVGVLAVTALYATGAALGVMAASLGRRARGAQAEAGAGLLLLLTAGLTALPALGGAALRPLTPERVALLLELSPVVWVCESAGLDWMRHASVYEVAGAGDLGPDLRAAHTGAGGPALVLVGALVIGLTLGRRRDRAQAP